MSTKKVFYLMLGVTLLLSAGVIAATILGSGKLESHSKKLVNLKLEEALIGGQQAALISAKKDVEKYKDYENITNSIVPQDKDQAKAVRDIIQIARDNNITIESVNFPNSTLGSKASATAKTEGTESQTKQPVTAPITQAKPVSGIAGVYALQLDITPESNAPITYQELINFLERLENNRRTAQISKLNINPRGNRLVFSLSINIFIKP